MKKIISLLLVFVLSLALLPSCASLPQDEGLSIVATVFPVYDWVKSITAESGDFSLTLIQKNGVDIHSFQPTAEDIAKISSCDILIYVGGESESWVADAIANAVNPEMITLCLTDTLKAVGRALDEEALPGIAGEEEEEEETDEHIWLSVKNALSCIEEIKNTIEKKQSGVIDGEKYSAYISDINALEEEYSAAAEGGKTDTLIFADRFPFLYLMKDYGLNYYAAFSGCSTESDADFETITFLAEICDTLGAEHIIILEGSSQKVADAVINASESKTADILTLDSMQSYGIAAVKEGKTWLGIMRENLTVIKTALGSV